MSECDSEIRRPVRWVLRGWGALALLFAASAPFVDDVPRARFLGGGILYSLMLVSLSVGVALLGRRRATGTLFVIAAIAVPAMIAVAAVLILEAPMEVVGLVLGVSQVIFVAVFAALAILSVCGWIRYCRQVPGTGQPDDQAGPLAGN